MHRLGKRRLPGPYRTVGTFEGTQSSTKDVSVTGTIPHGGRGVAVGQFAQVHRAFSQDEVATFGRLVGDENPLHRTWDNNGEIVPDVVRHHPLISWQRDEHGGESARAVVHGMLVSSLFSSIFGTLIPGSVYRKQSLDFLKPVYVDEHVLGRVTVTSIRTFPRQQKRPRRGAEPGVVLTCDTNVFLLNHGQTVESTDLAACVSGKADVWIVKDFSKEDV